MPTNAPLQRSNRKRAGLAALVALACSTPVAAQAPSIVETVAYINSRCVDYAWDSAIAKETTLIMHADDGSITLASRTDYFGNDESVYVITDSFDLRRVEIVKSRRYADDLDDFINFRCGANAHWSPGIFSINLSARRPIAKGPLRTSIAANLIAYSRRSDIFNDY